MSLELTLDFADSKTFRIPLRWNNQPFAPSSSWRLVWTMKTALSDPDDEALIQKATSGLGITVAGDNALVTVVPIDTRGDAEEDPVIPPVALGTYYWGILAQHTTTGERHHVAEGTLVLSQGATQEDEVSVPVYTTEPPVFPVNGAVRYDVAQTLDAGEKTQALTNIGAQPVDANIVSVASPVNDDMIQRVGGSWVTRTIAQVRTALGLGTAAYTASTDYATAAQGSLADSAIQPSDLATVATTGAYADLSGKPTLGNSAALNVGTTAGTVAAGDDARLSDARTPLSHTHGNISNDGKIGSTENLPIITTTSGVLTTGSFGTTANTFTQGNDSRLSDERVPTAAGLTTKFGTAKATPVDADKVAILDSAASDAPNHSTLSAIWTWIQSKFAGASSKTTPIDADSFNLVDSADSNAAKRVTGTNLKAYLKTYLDTLYVALTGDQTIAGNKTLSGNTVMSGNLTVDTNTLFVDAANNRVGVGTASPASALEISTGGTTNVKFGAGSAAGYNAFTLNGNLTDGNAVGFIGGGGSDTNFYLNSGNAGDFYFRTGNGSSYANKIVLKNNGKIGLNGATSPSAYLDFGSTVPNVGQILNIYNAANLVSGLGMDSGTANLRLYSPSSGFIDFGNISTANGTTFTSKMQLDVSSGTLTLGSGTWNGSTIAGAQAFSSTTRPTSSGTGTPASNSLITRADADSRYWSPRMISGITLYLEANELLYQGTATPTDGSEVTSWKSAHRNGTSEISVVQAGGTLKPLFKTSVQNSLNGVLFDGSNDLLQSATGYNGFVSNTGRTMFVVCRPTVQVSTGSGTSYARPQLVANLSQFNGIAVSPSGSGNIFTAWDYDSSGALIQASTAEVATNTAVVITNRHQTGTSLIQVNKSTPVTATTLRECTNGSALQIGTSGGSAYYTGYIFETIIFGRALSNDEISAVQDFLISKWGI